MTAGTALRDLALEAGRVILAVRDEGFDVDTKGDASPVTRADVAAERIILHGLRRMIAAGALPDLPLVAEEAVATGGVPELSSPDLILIDPLDGTREFVAGNDDFTVNIAVVRDGAPIIGVVHRPGDGGVWWAEDGAAYVQRNGEARKIRCASADRLRILASRSHRTPETDAWIERVIQSRQHEIVACGSSLKFCRIAEGAADLYPRFGRTMEWDSAAGDAVLRAAGGMTFDMDGRPLTYGRGGDFSNPDFVATSKAEARLFANA